jgi:hypothetical protein
LRAKKKGYSATMKTAGCVTFVHFLIAFALDSIVAPHYPHRSTSGEKPLLSFVRC